MPSEGRKHSPLQRIEDILESIADIRSFSEGMDLEAFLGDKRTRHAVTRALEIISEASRHLPPDLKSRHPAIDWRGMAAAGNVYRHGYDALDDVYVWDVVKNDLEPLRIAMAVERERLIGET